MESVISNDLSLLVRALEMHLEQGKGLRPWVVFPSSSCKGYLYDALARAHRPYAFEPFYLDELLNLIGVGKKRMSIEHKQWRLESLLEKEGLFNALGEKQRRMQIERQAQRLAFLFDEIEQHAVHLSHLEPREHKLWEALFSDPNYAPLDQLTAKLPEGIALHAFGFSLLPASWQKILEELGATFYLLAPSSHFLGGSGLLGAWSSLCCQHESATPLMVAPESVASHAIYAPYLLPEMGLIRGMSQNRLAYLKADVAFGREGDIELPKDQSVMAYSIADEAAFAAQLVREAIERGVLAKEILLFGNNKQALAAELKREGIPFTLLGMQPEEEKARLCALRLPLGPCQRADLERLAAFAFPKGEVLLWLKRVRGGRGAFFSEVKKWAEEIVEQGQLMRSESLGEELAAFVSLVEEVFILAALAPRPIADWAGLFSIELEQSFALDVDIAIPYSSAVTYFERALARAKGAPNFNQDMVRVAPLDARFVLPAKCSIVTGMGESPTREKIPGLPSALSQGGLALLHLIGHTSEQMTFICDEMPGPLLCDLLRYFPIPLQQALPVTKGGGALDFDFFTTWKKPALCQVETLPCCLSAARCALVDPIGWFMKKKREVIALDRLIPTPLEQAICKRARALQEPYDLDLQGPFAQAALELIEAQAIEKRKIIDGLGPRKRLIFARGVAHPIMRDEDHFFPATWLEGAISNVCNDGIIVFGKDEAKVRARHLPDLALLASIGKRPRLCFVDLDKIVEYRGPFSLEAMAHFVALAKAQPAPLFPEAIEPLLAGDEAAFDKVTGHPGLLEMWQPIARGLYGDL